jgi:hypothetical protein
MTTCEPSSFSEQQRLSATSPSGLALPPLSSDPRAATPAHPHWVYTADELATLDAASIDWPAVPEELNRYDNGEACAANGITDGLAVSSPGQRASSGVNPIWSPRPHCSAATLDPVPPGTASCLTYTTASGSTSNQRSTTFIYARTACGALAPTSSRSPRSIPMGAKWESRPTANGLRCSREVLSIKSHSISGSQQ